MLIRFVLLLILKQNAEGFNKLSGNCHRLLTNKWVVEKSRKVEKFHFRFSLRWHSNESNMKYCENSENIWSMNYEWFPFPLECEWQIKLSSNRNKKEKRWQNPEIKKWNVLWNAERLKINSHLIHNPFIFQRTVKSLNNFIL